MHSSIVCIFIYKCIKVVGADIALLEYIIFVDGYFLVGKCVGCVLFSSSNLFGTTKQWSAVIIKSAF